MLEKLVELDITGVRGAREKSSSWNVISSSGAMTCRGEGFNGTSDVSLPGLAL
jgi:hypothetical protein